MAVWIAGNATKFASVSDVKYWPNFCFSDFGTRFSRTVPITLVGNILKSNSVNLRISWKMVWFTISENGKVSVK